MRWRDRTRSDAGKGGRERWAIVDVEASGLDAAHDRLLAIAGVAVEIDGGVPRIRMDDSFEVVLRQDRHVAAESIDRENILLHGIGIDAQRTGIPAAQALHAFWQWVGGAPVVGYHAAFDRTLIQRYTAAHLGHSAASAWVDLEHVVRLVLPALPDRSLDAAMERLGITCLQRHLAAADALATAEVLLRIWTRARAEMGGQGDFRAFARLAGRHRWLPGGR